MVMSAGIPAARTGFETHEDIHERARANVCDGGNLDDAKYSSAYGLAEIARHYKLLAAVNKWRACGFVARSAPTSDGQSTDAPGSHNINPGVASPSQGADGAQ